MRAILNLFTAGEGRPKATRSASLVGLAALTLGLLVPASLIGQTPTVFRACVAPSSGVLYRIAVTGTPAACTKTSHTEITWNQVGPKGDKGDQGIPGTNGTNGTNGAPGAPATRLWALVRGTDAAMIRNSGATQAFKFNGLPGAYEIAFNQDVSGCAYVATVANETAGRGNAAPSGQVGVRALSTSASGVSVSTYDAAGVAADRSFMIAVFC